MKGAAHPGESVKLGYEFMDSFLIGILLREH